MKLLLVASNRMEFAALPQSRLGAHEIRLAANGAGARHAATAVDLAISSFSPDAIVSLGFCGALDPTLAIADIVVGATVLAGDTTFPAACPQSTRPHRRGAVCTIDHVAGTAGEKRRLHASSALAVDMETAGVAQRALSLKLPFYCIKSVTDLAAENMSLDFNAALRSDGRFDTIRILASSFRHPIIRLPELLRLRKRSVLAARALGEFIADCRF